MEKTTQYGYLVLADISGYTSYLAGVELDHAHEILTDLLETIVNRFKSALTISKLEGDAVFAYVPESRLQRGETLLELIESTYLSFRDRREAAHRRTTCECNACRSIPKLDLKFLAHHGAYIVQQVTGINELVGSDVNLIHRLLKNHVSEATGWRAYALFTEACLLRTGVQPEGARELAESYEHLGAVKTYSLDLHPRYQTLKEARRVFIKPDEAIITVTHDYPLPPPALWSWLNDPQKIAEWAGRDMQPNLRPAGRTGAGARNHCIHGKNLSMIETVLDWQPFDYFTVEQASQMMPMNFYLTYQLEPTPAGTRLTVTMKAKLKQPLPNALAPAALKLVNRVFGMDKEYDALARLIVEEAAQEGGEGLAASAAAASAS